MTKVERLTLEEAKRQFDFGVVGIPGVIDPTYQYEQPHKPELPRDPDVNGFRRGTIQREGASAHYYRYDRYVSKKPNRHILICGASGCGKTTVFCSIIQTLWERQRIPSLVLGFKPYRSQKEEITPYLDGIEVLDALQFLPDPFRSRESFIDAYLTTYWISRSKIGIMASNVPVIIGSIWKGCESWEDLLAKLETRLGETRDNIEKSILITAKKCFTDDLIPQGKGERRRFKWDYQTPLYLDFQNMSDTQKVFYGKLLLHEVYDALNKPDVSVPKFMIAVDEAHKVFRETVVSAEQSAMSKICRLARSQGGRVLLSSQNLNDIGSDKFSQVRGAQFISIDNHPADARIFRDRHPRLPEYVQSLRKFDFIDLTARDLLHDFRVFRVTKLPELNEKITSADPEKFSVEGVKEEALKREKVRITDEELENLLLKYLSKHASYVSELGRELGEKLGQDPAKVKAKCHRLLKPLVSSGAIRRRKLEDAYGNKRVYYFSRDAAESLFHRSMINLVKGLISREGFELLPPEANCDTAFKFENKKIGVECETGLKTDLSEFAGDLHERCKVYDQVWVICRNRGDRKRYYDKVKPKVGSPNVRFKNLKSCREALRR